MTEIEQPSKKPSSGPRWQRKKEQRPDEIIDAARQLFIAQGYAATKVSQIAKLSGVQPGTLYVYFENKQELFKAVIRSSLEPLLAYADREISSYTGTTQNLIRRLVHEYWELVESEKSHGIVRLVVAEAKNFPEFAEFYTQHLIAPTRTMICRVLEYALKQNELKLLNIEMASRIIFMVLHETIMYADSFSEFDPQPVSQQAILNAVSDFIIRSVLKDEG